MHSVIRMRTFSENGPSLRSKKNAKANEEHKNEEDRQRQNAEAIQQARMFVQEVRWKSMRKWRHGGNKIPNSC